MISWQRLQFEQLTTHQLYDLLKLRVDVFVVEQNCPYPELDDKDRAEGVYQLLGYQYNQETKSDELVACARLLPKGISFDAVSFGRIATKMSARGSGIGRQLLQKTLDECQDLWPNQPIKIQAQQYLTEFYQSFGFVGYTDAYLEDGIPHIDMQIEK